MAHLANIHRLLMVLAAWVDALMGYAPNSYDLGQGTGQRPPTGDYLTVRWPAPIEEEDSANFL